MTAGWDDDLAALREAYLREAGERLTRLERALDVLALHPRDRPALDEVRRAFHGFAGSGTTYGLAGISRLGLQGERRGDGLGSGPPVAGDVAFWRRVVEGLRAEVERAGAAPRAAATEPAARILALEVDPARAAHLRSVLSSAGYDVHVVEDPARLEVERAAFRPDLVLTDLPRSAAPAVILRTVEARLEGPAGKKG